MTTRLQRLALGGALVALVVLVATGWLVARAIDGVHRAEATRHAAVVEDLFDELERELSALVSREERRSFLEYRHVYVPPGNVAQGPAGLVRSPLAEPPDDPAIVGYFQLEPGGGCTSPSVPRPNELDVAVASGWSPSPELEARQAEMRAVVDEVVAWKDELPSPPEPVQVAKQQAQQQAYAPTVQLKRGSSGRNARSPKVVSTSKLNLDAWNPSEQDVVDNVQQANAMRVTNAASEAPVFDDDVAVRVSPMEGTRVDEHLVLHRTVRIDGAEHRQGLVLRLPALADSLEGAVLGGSELDPFVWLAWDDPLPSRRATYTFDHRFAPPFEGWTVTASVATIPELSSSEGWWLGGLAGLVVTVVLVGGLGIGRAVRAEVELAQRRSDFAAAVTHELKTPLTTIRMYGEMLRDGVVADPDRQREYHGTLVTEAERLSRLVGNVLELSRIERGVPCGETERLDPADVLRETATLVTPLVDGAGASLEVAAASGLPEVVVERDALVQALSNLVENAVKFSTDAADRRVHLSVGRVADDIAFVVRDHGPGVPRGQLPQIFDPFFRGERELTRRTTGTGIGLALVAGLAQRSGGAVTARNHPEGGLEVTVTLPGATR